MLETGGRSIGAPLVVGQGTHGKRDIAPGDSQHQPLGLRRPDLERNRVGAVPGRGRARLLARGALHLAVDGDDAYVLEDGPGVGIRPARFPLGDLYREDHVDAVAGVNEARLAGGAVDQDGDGAVVGPEGGGKEPVLPGAHDGRPGKRHALVHRSAHHRSDHFLRLGLPLEHVGGEDRAVLERRPDHVVGGDQAAQGQIRGGGENHGQGFRRRRLRPGRRRRWCLGGGAEIQPCASHEGDEGDAQKQDDDRETSFVHVRIVSFTRSRPPSRRAPPGAR